MKLLRLMAGAALAAASLTTAAGAVTHPVAIPVSMTPGTGCANVTFNPLNFGTVASGTGAAANTTISVTCTSGTPYKILLNAGAYCSAHTGCPGSRVAVDGNGDQVDYNFYQDAALQTLWGDDDATFNAASESDTGTGGAQTVTVYGELATCSCNPSATYTDTATATVSF